uniref:AlNc14C1G120 protein n=1 Tax=Albugo laibachii Nc14 TaxID=890382 RepID=F0VYW9_9STRA|nr:AlNc14C1G120 [Albugo laibachii Nc14]|eukprot:CCA13984.1 AlNc14C1G120 [Albugo laibachii Nc14]
MTLIEKDTIAFTYVANLDPLIGLHPTGIFAIVISLFGGVPGTIAGAAGALAVVMPQSIGSLGLKEYFYSILGSYLYVAMLLAGFMQFLFGLLHLTYPNSFQ